VRRVGRDDQRPGAAAGAVERRRGCHRRLPDAAFAAVEDVLGAVDRLVRRLDVDRLAFVQFRVVD